MKKNYLKKTSYFLIFIILIGCNGKDYNQSSTKLVVSDTVFTINIDSSQNFEITEIRDAVFNYNNEIIFLDRNLNKLIFYSLEGVITNEIILKTGRGPGEVLQPNSVYVDENNFVYVTDRDQRKFIVFDKNGNFYNDAALDMMPSNIVAIDTNNVFITGFRFTSNDSNLVQLYSLSNNFYSKKTTFSTKINFGNERFTNMAGYSDYIHVFNNNLIVSHFVPYNIEVYNANLDLLTRINSDNELIKEPVFKNGTVFTETVMREVIPLNDFYLVRYKNFQDTTSLDFYDFYNKDWNLLDTYNSNELEIMQNGKFYLNNKSTKSNSLYVLYENESIVLVRYDIKVPKN